MKKNRIKRFYGQNRNLLKLYRTLNFEIPGGVLFVAGIAHDFAFYIFTLATVIVSPYFLKILYEEKRYGWVISYTIVVVLCIIVYLSFEKLTFLYMALMKPTIMGLLSLYFVLLKISLPSMIE